jgi:hypothetical protein
MTLGTVTPTPADVELNWDSKGYISLYIASHNFVSLYAVREGEICHYVFGCQCRTYVTNVRQYYSLF